jgi:hypothetical protein
MSSEYSLTIKAISGNPGYNAWSRDAERINPPVVLECVIQPRVVAARRRDDEPLEIRIDGSGGEPESEPFPEVSGCLLPEKDETVKLGIC